MGLIKPQWQLTNINGSTEMFDILDSLESSEGPFNITFQVFLQDNKSGAFLNTENQNTNGKKHFSTESNGIPFIFTAFDKESLEKITNDKARNEVARIEKEILMLSKANEK